MRSMDCTLPVLVCPWNSSDKNTGVGCHFLLQGIFPTQGSNPSLLHCRYIVYHLSHQESPYIFNSFFKLWIIWRNFYVYNLYMEMTHFSTYFNGYYAKNSAGKDSTCSAGELGSIPGLGRSLGEGNGYPLQYSCLENPKGCKEWDTPEWLSLFHEKVSHDSYSGHVFFVNAILLVNCFIYSYFVRLLSGISL